MLLKGLFIFVVLVAVLYTFLRFTPIGRDLAKKILPENIRSALMLKGEEEFSEAIIERSTLPIVQRLEATVHQAYNVSASILSRFVDKPSDAELKELYKGIEMVANQVYQEGKGDEEYIINNVAEAITKKIKEIGSGIVERHTDIDRVKLFQENIDKELPKEIKSVIDFSIVDNPLAVSNILQRSDKIRDMLYDFHFRRESQKEREIREVEPYQKRGSKLDVRNNLNTRNTLDLILTDQPSLRANQSLLPIVTGDTKNTVQNLEIANLIHSNKRYYRKPSATVRSRGPDTRPLPKALIDKIMAQRSSRDPNSLQQSTEFDPLDILESGRGHSGNEQIDAALEELRSETSTDFVKDFDRIAESSIMKYPSGSIVDRGQEDDIVADLKYA